MKKYTWAIWPVAWFAFWFVLDRGWNDPLWYWLAQLAYAIGLGWAIDFVSDAWKHAEEHESRHPDFWQKIGDAIIILAVAILWPLWIIPLMVMAKRRLRREVEGR